MNFVELRVSPRRKKPGFASRTRAEAGQKYSFYFCGEVLDCVVELSVLPLEPVPFFDFFTCFFFVLLFVPDVWLCVEPLSVDWFCAFLAAGAAIRNGTATTVSRVDVNSFFIQFFSSIRGDLPN